MKDIHLFDLEPLPKDEQEAEEWLVALVQAAAENRLNSTSLELFKRGWYAIGFLYTGLHPDSALSHGSTVSECTETDTNPVDRRLITPFYIESGWPVALAPIAEEAWRRYGANELADNELYYSEAVLAGMCFRNPEIAAEVRQERAGTPESQ
jgi:DNA (cytosine-5)-methyltransferase 1